MKDETEEQHLIDAEHFGKDQPEKKQSGNLIDVRGEEMQPQILRSRWCYRQVTEHVSGEY